VIAWCVLAVAALRSDDSLAGVAVITMTLLAIAAVGVIWFGVLVGSALEEGRKARPDTAGVDLDVRRR